MMISGLRTIISMSIVFPFVLSLSLAASAQSQPAASSIKQQDVIDRGANKTITSLELAERIADRVISGGYQKELKWSWHYPTGVIYWSLLNLSEVSPKGKGYLDFVESHFDTHIRDDQVRYTEVNESMGLSLFDLHQRVPKPEYKDALRKISDYYYRDQPRDFAGTICFKGTMPRNAIWIDALFFVCPLECQAAKMFDDPARIDWSLMQIFQQTARLFDNEKKLYYQGWGWGDLATQHSPGFWSRGNGWVAITLAEVLKRLPKDHPDYQKTLDLFKTLCAGILKVQSDNGMWHQMLDMPESYEETSGTAMFVYAFVRGFQNGWLDREYADAAVKGLKGLNQKVDKDGNIYGTCIGTGPMDTIEIYLHRPTPVNDWHGIGPIILAASAVAELEAAKF